MVAGATLLEIILGRLEQTPDRPVFHFHGEPADRGIDYAGLALAGRRVASQLGGRTEPVALCCGGARDFIQAFAGALFSGRPAVPLMPPRGPGENLDRFVRILRDCGATDVVISEQLRPAAEMLRSMGLEIRVTSVDEGDPGGWSPPRVDGSSAALLQYTSGSTGNPKGVAILQQNLVANLAYIERAFGLHPGSRGVTWLPPYHDMGLIGCILAPLFGGWPILVIDTLRFIQRPHLWLDAISSFHATHSGGPSFAYQLCCDRIPAERRAELDLSSWEVAFNGAEPVRAAVMDRFARTFSPAGFRARAFLPCYGLAEATLMVTCADRDADPRLLHVDRRLLASGEVVLTAENDPAAVALVGCGTADAAARITILDPETGAPSSPGRVGEIVYQGASRSAGYWGHPRVDVTAPLHTGDLGFIHDGETYVVGRLKDTVIHNGRKFHAEDLEHAIAHAHPALASALSTAVAVEDGESSKLIVLLEYRSALRAVIPPGPLVELVRTTLAESHGLQVDAVELIARLPRTTSGKVQRGRARQLYLANELAVRERP